MVKDALLAGKHVLSEKPLATSVADAAELVELAKKQGVRNCTNHNLRYYPLVQHMRRMREQGELGEILVVQGQYTQDYLLYDTDWNWRLDSKDSGPSCAMADIGSHFCDMTEHVTGLRITELCADLNTFHATRKRPTGWVESFAGKLRQGEQEYEEHPVDTEDYGAVLLRIGDRARGSFSAGQVFAGKKNGLSIEIYGTQSGGGVEPGASRGAVDRQPELLQPDPAEGPGAARPGGSALRRPTGGARRGVRRHLQERLPPLLPARWKTPPSRPSIRSSRTGCANWSSSRRSLPAARQRAWVDVPSAARGATGA